jgi:hypothetical protein
MRDESLSGGTYHGPSNSAGLTAREYYELQAERDDRYDYDGDGPDRNDEGDDDE